MPGDADGSPSRKRQKVEVTAEKAAAPAAVVKKAPAAPKRPVYY